jgi:hypothetical protein
MTELRSPVAAGDSQGTDTESRIRSLVLLAILAIAAVSYLSFIWSAIGDGRYMPAWSDEYAYYNNARSFIENHRLDAAYLLEENVARIGGFDAHGVAYTILNGLIARVSGMRPLSMIITNLVFLGLTLLLILHARFDRDQKTSIVSILLLYAVVPVWLFTYYPETMMAFFGVAAGLLLFEAYRSQSRARRDLYALGFAGIVALAGAFRPSWLVCMVGLVPLARNRREAAVLVLIVAASAAVALVYLTTCFAPYPYGFLRDATAALQARDIAGFASLVAGNFLTNIGYFLFKAGPDWPMPGVSPGVVAAAHISAGYLLLKYLLVLMCAMCFWVGIRERNRFALAVGILTAVNLLVLLVLYDSRNWIEHRLLAPAFLMMVLALAGRKRLMLLAPVMLLMLWPATVSYTTSVMIPPHRRVAFKYERSRELVQEFQDIKYEISDLRLTTVLLSRFLYVPADIPLMSLPLRSAQGYPIRYTFNLNPDEDQEVDDLTLHKPGFVDYVLVPDTLAGPAEDLEYVKLRLERVED